MKFREYLNEALDPSKTLAALFDDKTKKKALLKGKFFAKLFSPLMDTDTRPTTEDMFKILTNLGFTTEEQTEIRKMAVDAAKVAADAMVKKLKGKTKQRVVSQDKFFFKFYFNNSAFMDDNDIKEFNNDIKTEMTRVLNSIKG